MAFVLVVVGLLMIITGARGTYQQFGAQVASDFTGPGNFTYWLAALGAIGAVGYIEPLRHVSRLFLALVLIGMVLSNRGVFAKFQAAMKTGPVAPSAPSTATQGGGSGITTQSNQPNFDYHWDNIKKVWGWFSSDAGSAAVGTDATAVAGGTDATAYAAMLA